MDSTRISVARVLALDVPLTWQDAVAVAQEAAMLSEVTAAMNARPALVSPERCFITRDGDVELPDSADREAPEDVARLLRELLAGRDAPAEVEALAYAPTARDLSEELGAIDIGHRRVLIARLASRAFAVADVPATQDFVAPRPPMPTAVVQPFSARSVPNAEGDGRHSPPARPVLVGPRPQRPPFVATPLPPSAPAAAATATVSVATIADDEPVEPRATDAELRRLRHRTRERDRPSGVGVWLRQAIPWLTWRPDSPDPRVLGGAAVVIAGLVAMVWRADAPPATAARGIVTPRAAVTSPARVDAVPPPGVSSVQPPARAAGAAPSAATTSAPPPSAPPVTTAAPSTRSGSAPARRLVAAPPTPAAPPALVGPSRPETAPPTAPVVTPPAVAAGAASATESPRRPPDVVPSSPVPRPSGGRAVLYSASDAGVTPPVMRRQQLPSNLLEPTAEVPEDWPFLEIVVDERGAVEAVRLRANSVAPGQTMYRHRMLLAAAKAWQFDPATKDGLPVRYLMRVPLEP